ncbi:MAG: beta-ketoacyl-ACP synthase III, partial [Pseudomonadota bacterium]
MTTARIAATGLFTPPQSISNEELVASYNQYVDEYNADNAAAINAGTLTALEPSSASFVEKASGIKSRFVMDRAGILDTTRMAPHLPARPDDRL